MSAFAVQERVNITFDPEARAEVLPTLANIVTGRNTVTATEVLTRGRYNTMVMIWVFSFQLMGLLAFTQPFKMAYLPVMVGIYLWLGFGVTFYLHRCLSHKSFEATEPLKFIMAIGSAVGFSGDPVGWVGHHRHHHKMSDTINDIHSPRYGWWHAHMGWYLREPANFDTEIRKLASDLRKTGYLRALENPIVYALPHLIVAGLIFAWGGLPAVMYGLWLPLVVMMHHTYAINSITHLKWMGYKTYETGDDSVNSPWLLGALGEGWHNNHHHDARRAAHGLKWYEFDATKYLIWTMEKLGLVRDVVWK